MEKRWWIKYWWVFLIIIVVVLTIVSIFFLSTKTEVGASCVLNKTCQNIDCSSYDTGIVKGFKPFCVNNQCRCMCYLCE